MQALKYETKLLKAEEILDMVDKLWKDTTDAVVFSREWMDHHQVIVAEL